MHNPKKERLIFVVDQEGIQMQISKNQGRMCELGVKSKEGDDVNVVIVKQEGKCVQRVQQLEDQSQI